MLRKQVEQEAIEGRKPLIEWKDDDFAVVDGNTRRGRIYRTQLPAGEKWMWFLQITPAPLDMRTAAAPIPWTKPRPPSRRPTIGTGNASHH
jgi:hypothetical protein